MNYKTLTGLTALVATFALPAAAISSPTANLNRNNVAVESKLLIAQSVGQASYYDNEGGSVTATGERYNPGGYTAAHRSLPFGTRVRVTSVRTGRSVIVLSLIHI
jgi:rare lipoprotein A